MISSVLSHDEELEVNNAYAKIGLIANRVWANDQEDSYIKLNRLLWVKNCKLSEIYEGNNERKSRRVRDVIPASRLANYGNYEYNEEREKMYKASDETRGTWPDQREQSHRDDRARCNEPWMLIQVEDYFVRLSSPVRRLSSSLSKVQPDCVEIIGTETKTKDFEPRDDFGKYSPPSLYTVLDRAEQQLQARVCNKLVKDLWNARSGHSCRWERTRGICDSRFAFNNEKLQKIRQTGERRQENKKYYEKSSCSPSTDQTLITKRQNFVDANVAEYRRPVFPVLSAEVPEFFPKGPPNNDKDRQGPLQFFPSSSERNYHDELFPYNRVHTAIPQNTGCVPVAVSHPTTINTLIRTPHQWIHRMVSPIQIQVPAVCTAVHPPIYSAIQPICPTIIHRPMSLHEKIIPPGQANPVPIPVYQRPAELYQESSQRRSKNHHGVDFNNLILLTKNAMKARRNQSKNPRQASSFILESRQPNLKSERDVLQWLDKGYPKRAREFATVNSLVSELSRFEVECCQDCSRENTLDTGSEYQIRENSELTRMDNLDESSVEETDVPIAKKRLYRDVLTNSSSSDFILESLLDRRYDELEQQAMEQYRTSEECLALRYQELERQALEQYKNSESSVSSSESIRTKRSSMMCEKKDWKDDEREAESRDDGTICSGFGNRSCNNSGKDISSERGTASERQITILRSEKKCSSVPTTGTRCSVGQNINNRGTTVVTKSLTALKNENFEVNSKNTIKGASGDKIEERGQSSLSNRHLILVSPLKQSIPMRTDVTNDKGIYYRKPTTIDGGIASGGGDEKVTILRSPSAQVWLSSFWG